MICEYGCGQEARHQFKNGKWCCGNRWEKCSSSRRKRSKLNKEIWSDISLKERQSEIIKRVWRDPTTKEKITEAQKEGWNKPGVKEHQSKLSKQAWNKLGVKEKFAEIMKEVQKEVQNRPEMKKRHRELMLNGASAHAASFIKNPSKEELALRKIVKELYPQAEHTYKVLDIREYTVDNALVEEKIVIEFDGYHHFKNQEAIGYHDKRQKEIETQDWRFIRYNIFQKFPSKEQVKQDIDNFINEVRGKLKKGSQEGIDATANKNVCTHPEI